MTDDDKIPTRPAFVIESRGWYYDEPAHHWRTRIEVATQYPSEAAAHAAIRRCGLGGEEPRVLPYVSAWLDADPGRGKTFHG